MEESLEKVIEEMLELFSKITPLTVEAKEDISKIFGLKFIKKDTMLVYEGKRLNKIWYLHDGLLRSYFSKDDKECTTWIMMDKFPFTNYRSFITSEPSIENIITVEDCILLETTREKVYDIYMRHHCAETLGRKIAEMYFIRHDAHLHSILFSSAEDRYNEFVSKMPNIIDRMKAKDIATYLGISKETFSRITTKNKKLL